MPNAHPLSEASVTHFLRFSKSNSMAVTYLDFQKAYDSVDNKALMCVLKILIDGNRIVESLKL